MSKIVKEIAGLCYHLDKLYTAEHNGKIKKEIGKNFDIMSGILDKAIRSQFNENDPLYKKSVRKMRKYSKMIREESELLDKYDKFFTGLSSLGEQLEEFFKALK